MTLNRIQIEAHTIQETIQEILKSFLFLCRRASSQTCLFFLVFFYKNLNK